MTRPEAVAKVREFRERVEQTASISVPLLTQFQLANWGQLSAALEVLCDDAAGLPRVAASEAFCACGRVRSGCDGSRAGCAR